MNLYGIDIPIQNVPGLDPNFIPLLQFNRAFLKGAAQPFGVAVERSGGQIATYHTFIHGTPEMAQADRYYIDRLVKTVLWMKGGFRLFLSGSRDIYEQIRAAYSVGGARDFDRDFMESVFERPFEVLYVDAVPEENTRSEAIGKHVNGNRIGFDVGGSDLKVSAVIDGETVFSTETVWLPKLNSDPQYHYDYIVDSLKQAAAHLPSVDGVGISASGVIVDNKSMVSHVYNKVKEADPELFERTIKNIYLRTVKDCFGDVPMAVCNDGDVTALAGAMSFDRNSILGISMGTSEAVGFVDASGNITGWFNELAFLTIDANPNAPADEWSGDIGCGVKYLAQDAVIRLAGAAGIELSDDLTLAEQLVEIQKHMEAHDPAAADIYDSVGVYLGHTLALYCDLYGCTSALLLGRVMSGEGGEILLRAARRVLDTEYPEYKTLELLLPDEKFRRVGQSVAAASLPDVK